MSRFNQELLASLSLEKVLKTVPSGLFVVDLEQRILSWNSEAERITGYQASEVLGRHCSFLAGIPCGRGCGLFDPSLPKPIIGVACSIRGKDGQQIHLTKNVDYLRDQSGNIIGAIESFADVTSRRRLEVRLRLQSRQLERTVRQRTRQLEDEQARLRTVFDTMADFAYISGPDFQIHFINRAMSEVFGETTRDLCYEVFHNFSAPCSWCPMPRVLAGETVQDERFFAKNHRTYEIIHTPLPVSDGQFLKLAVHRDITARKEAEEKLLEANRELDAFVYTVSHDLRSPLTPIIGFAEFLQEEYRARLDSQGLELLGEIETQGHKMLALLEDLLSLSRVGRIPLPDAPVPLFPVLREVLDHHSQEINRLQLVITVGDLPALAVPETLLSELFSNLIGNAIRYAAAPQGRIEVGSIGTADPICLFVRDHGPGIPEEERQKIFDPFYRGSTAGKTPGTGIGLATVRKIVRLYGGRTWVEETPGGGASFWIEFPSFAD